MKHRVLLICAAVMLLAHALLGAPVEWKIANGGNGHFYDLTPTPCGWTCSNSAANSVGGYLATILSQEEQDFVLANFGGEPLFWLGLTDQAVEGTFAWVTGEPLGYTNWFAGEPNNFQGAEDWTILFVAGSGKWFDATEPDLIRGLVEFNSNPIPEPSPSLLMLPALLGLFAASRFAGRSHAQVEAGTLRLHRGFPFSTRQGTTRREVQQAHLGRGQA